MNFDDAVKAHAAWKMKLKAYLDAPDKSLKVDEVGSDCRCDLGRWIHGDGKQFAAHPEYGRLKDEHAKFHRAAADIVRKADAGHNVGADVALGTTSPFSAASTAVVTAIMAMKRRLGS